MKILTIGHCPYILSSFGSIHAEILKRLEEHEVISMAWFLDKNWHMPDEDGVYRFKTDGKTLGRIYPATLSPDKAVVQLYELVRDFKPDIVLSLSNSDQIEFIAAVKQTLPDAFRWLAILAIDALPLLSSEHLGFADAIISLNKFSQESIQQNASCDVIVAPYFPTREMLPFCESSKELELVCLSKNMRGNSLPAVIKAACQASEQVDGKIKLYVHTNFSDPGESDLIAIKNRYDKHDIVSFPEHFSSINESLSQEDYFVMLSKKHVVVDASSRSGTALGILDGLVSGCIPVLSPAGKLLELSGGSYLATAVDYSEKNKDYKICDPNSLSQIFIWLYQALQDGQDWQSITERSGSFRVNLAKESNFLKVLSSTLEKLISKKPSVLVQKIS